MGNLRRAPVCIALLSLVGPSCKEDSATPASPLLVVQAAQEQPTRDDLGVIVVIQSRGGAWLEVEVAGGSLAGGKTARCLRAPTAESLRENRLDVIVYPQQVEAVVTVRLLPDAKPVAEGGAGGSGAPGDDELGPCRMDARPLRQVIKPLQRVNVVPATPSGGSAGMSGSGGSGGAPEAGASGTGGGGAGGAGSSEGSAAGEPNTGGINGGGESGAPGVGGQ
jgi:hypothetical protein